MATFNSDVAAKQIDPHLGNRMDPMRTAANVIHAEALVVIPSGAAAADVFRLIKLPSRAQIIPHLSKIEAENPGTLLTLDVGDDDPTADPDRYADGVAVSAGGSFDFTGGAAARTPYTLKGESWITATFATVDALTTGQEIRFRIAYAINN